MMKVRKFSSHRSVRFALRPLHMLRFIIATFYYGEYLFYLTVRESANNSQLRNMLLFFFFFLFKFKNKGIVPEFSLSLSLKKSVSQHYQTWDSSFLFHPRVDSWGCRADTFDLVKSNKEVKYDTSRLGVCADAVTWTFGISSPLPFSGASGELLSCNPSRELDSH